MRFRSRIARLEDRQRRQHRPGEQHFSSVVTVPETIPAEEWHAWLASQPCACGVVGSPETRIGLLLPTRAQTAEEWEARYRHKPRPDPVSFPQAELTVILNRIEGEP